jgi:hypothetical protein
MMTNRQKPRPQINPAQDSIAPRRVELAVVKGILILVGVCLVLFLLVAIWP